MTTTPPATLASHAASPAVARAASRHRERADHGVARAGHVRDLVAAVDRHERDRPFALEEGHAAAAPGDEEQARVEPLEHRAPRLLDGRLVAQLLRR